MRRQILLGKQPKKLRNQLAVRRGDDLRLASAGGVYCGGDQVSA
jgi:hypothetical protein